METISHSDFLAPRYSTLEVACDSEGLQVATKQRPDYEGPQVSFGYDDPTFQGKEDYHYTMAELPHDIENGDRGGWKRRRVCGLPLLVVALILLLIVGGAVGGAIGGTLGKKGGDATSEPVTQTTMSSIPTGTVSTTAQAPTLASTSTSTSTTTSPPQPTRTTFEHPLDNKWYRLINELGGTQRALHADVMNLITVDSPNDSTEQ